MIEFLDELRLRGLRMPPLEEELKPGYWTQVARLGMRYFAGKPQFMNWVYTSFSVEKNRFVASVCWDIIELEQAQDQERP